MLYTIAMNIFNLPIFYSFGFKNDGTRTNTMKNLFVTTIILILATQDMKQTNMDAYMKFQKELYAKVRAKYDKNYELPEGHLLYVQPYDCFAEYVKTDKNKDKDTRGCVRTHIRTLYSLGFMNLVALNAYHFPNGKNMCNIYDVNFKALEKFLLDEYGINWQELKVDFMPLFRAYMGANYASEEAKKRNNRKAAKEESAIVAADVYNYKTPPNHYFLGEKKLREYNSACFTKKGREREEFFKNYFGHEFYETLDINASIIRVLYTCYTGKLLDKNIDAYEEIVKLGDIVDLEFSKARDCVKKKILTVTQNYSSVTFNQKCIYEVADCLSNLTPKYFEKNDNKKIIDNLLERKDCKDIAIKYFGDIYVSELTSYIKNKAIIESENIKNNRVTDVISIEEADEIKDDKERMLETVWAFYILEMLDFVVRRDAYIDNKSIFNGNFSNAFRALELIKEMSEYHPGYSHKEICAKCKSGLCKLLKVPEDTKHFFGIYLFTIESVTMLSLEEKLAELTVHSKLIFDSITYESLYEEDFVYSLYEESLLEAVELFQSVPEVYEQMKRNKLRLKYPKGYKKAA